MSVSKTNTLSEQVMENTSFAPAKNFLFTSESVSEGHPDKVADQISDAILDAHLKEDPKSRVAIETLIKSSMVVLAGEITSSANVHYEKVVRDTLKKIGYTSEEAGCDHNRAVVLLNISKQSPDIAQGVNENEGAFSDQGAGDQGLMFGFACDETPEFMPLPVALSHRLVSKLADFRHQEKVDYLRPDSKSQVTVLYQGFKPLKVETVVLSSQHTPEVSHKELEEFIRDQVISTEVPNDLIDSDTKILINPTGRFVSGGPDADCGLTGRKIIVDTYGGYGRHGGGAFSGKDPSKVDRSAAYAARYIAKNIVASGIAKRCEIQLAYAIGVAEPVSILVDTFGTGSVSDEKIAEKSKDVFDFRPKGIIAQLGLQNPIYQATASYGHFGRKPDSAGKGSFSWERVDLAKEFAKLS